MKLILAFCLLIGALALLAQVVSMSWFSLNISFPVVVAAMVAQIIMTGVVVFQTQGAERNNALVSGAIFIIGAPLVWFVVSRGLGWILQLMPFWPAFILGSVFVIILVLACLFPAGLAVEGARMGSTGFFLMMLVGCIGVPFELYFLLSQGVSAVVLGQQVVLPVLLAGWALTMALLR